MNDKLLEIRSMKVIFPTDMGIIKAVEGIKIDTFHCFDDSHISWESSKQWKVSILIYIKESASHSLEKVVVVRVSLHYHL